MSEELTPWQKFKQNLGESRPWHLLDPKLRTSDEIAKTRYDLCKSCEFFAPLTTQCHKCGCIMKVKTLLKNAECPVGKWQQDTTPSNEQV